MPFELSQIGAVLGSQRLLFGYVHLPVKDIDALDAELSSFVDDGFDGHFWIAEMPIGISANTQLNAFAEGFLLCQRVSSFSGKSETHASTSRREERASIHHK